MFVFPMKFLALSSNFDDLLEEKGKLNNLPFS
jgi:hypothetical protein